MIDNLRSLTRSKQVEPQARTSSMEILTVDSFLAYWRKIHLRTQRVVRCIPSGRIDWSYSDGRWTLGDLVRHLAMIERWMFVENALGRPSRYRHHDRSLAADRDSVLELFERLDRDSMELLGQMPDARLLERCETPGGASLPVWKWLRAMVEHHCHHRGQIYLYLSMLGVETPPLYGLTAEQVHQRSVG